MTTLPSDRDATPFPAAGIVIATLGAGHPDFHLARLIRRRVFIEEQHVPEEEEWDVADAAAVHFLATLRGEPVATVRFFGDGGWLHIGRAAVLPEWRSYGLGRRLLVHCLEKGRALGFRRSFLNAQSDKIVFYQKLGFEAKGEEFMEAGIPHRRMELRW